MKTKNFLKKQKIKKFEKIEKMTIFFGKEQKVENKIFKNKNN